MTAAANPRLLSDRRTETPRRRPTRAASGWVGEPLHRLEQVFDEFGAIVLDETQTVIDIEAVHDDVRRRTRIDALPFLEDAPVIVDRGFRAEAADDSERRRGHCSRR